MRTILFLFFYVFLGASSAWAKDPHIHNEEQDLHHGHAPEDGGEEDVSSNIGPGFAVTDANHENGFKLSEKAVKTLGLEWKPIPVSPVIVLPKSSIVVFKDECGVYRMRDGWIKLVEGDARIEGNKAVFTPKEQVPFKTGDQVVINGVPLLRVAELDTFSGGEAGHAH